MCSRRLLLLGALLFPGALGAQTSEAVLRHRVAVLAARYLEVQRAVARRDSLAIAHEDLVPLGGPPLRILVPRWVAPEVAAPVAAIVDSWAIRTGPLFAMRPAETVTIGFWSDTAGVSSSQREYLAEHFPYEVTARARRAVDQRVLSTLGTGFASWMGGQVPAFPFDRGRRAAVLALATDTLGVGRRCLEGEVTACLASLDDRTRKMDAVRQSLVAAVMEGAGPAGWGTLAADTIGEPGGRLAAAGGVSYQEEVARWITRLRSAHAEPRGELVGMILVALGWGVLLLLLFLWRLTWHRA